MTSMYKSDTHGPIPLSMEARKLMMALRDAISGYKADKHDWKPVAHARGELAKYMSTLERVAEPWRERYPSATEVNMRQERERLERAKLERYRKDPWDGFMQQHAEQLMKPWYSRYQLTGSKADTMILDDPQQELSEMAKKKAVAARKKAEAKFRVIGVRFLTGTNLAKVYAYKVRKAAKIHLGQELVVTNDSGISVVIVVALDQPLDVLGWTIENLKEITTKVAAL